MSGHTHDYRPLVDLTANNSIGWMARLTANPSYPFQCLTCDDVAWLHPEDADDRGLIRIGYRHGAKDPA